MRVNDYASIRLAFALLLLCSGAGAWANGPVVYSRAEEVLPVSSSLEYLEDKTGSMHIREVLQSTQFKTSTHSVANFGVSSSTYWIKLSILNQTLVENLVLELGYPLLDEVTIYHPSAAGSIDSVGMGENEPFHFRKYRNQNYLFDLRIAPNRAEVYYLRIKSSDQLLVPLSIGTYQAVSEIHTKTDLITGIYFGIVIVMLLYNLFIYFTVNDKSYLYYVIYLFFIGLTQITLQGYGFRYLWPQSPWLAQKSVFLTGAFSGIVTILFAKSFLHTRQYTPGLNKILSVYQWAYVLCIVLSLLELYRLSYTLIDLNAGPGSLFLLYVAFVIYKRNNYRPAKFFLIAQSIFLLSVTVFVLKDYGVLPYNVFTNYGLQMGSAAEVVLLSFALADRINTLKREKEASQMQALDILKENERIIKEQNVMLDTKVKERTRELQESNRELNVTLKRLKEAQAQLVNAEKMASVGQLTAGIAHEINNPINFVSAAMKPLRRNIGYFLEVLDKYEHTSVRPEVHPYFREAEALKKMYDIDYCKEEISIILQGIEDGASRTTEIVKGLRNFSRLDEAEIKLANINAGLDSTIILLQGSINGRIKLNKAYGDIPEVECYAGKLNQVFMNILTNGIQAIQAKGLPPGEGSITVQTRHTERDLIISFTDNGIGMSEEVKNKIFDPFFTTKEVGEGTGLGMSIVYSIIQMHEGSIVVESTKGVGTNITLTIPKTCVAAEK
jgi:signal transduction histidine kinase